MTGFRSSASNGENGQRSAGPSQAECEALHEVDLGIERLHRAHGHLVAFHHNIGRSMDHFADAEVRLRECGHEGIADALRAEYLPRGVITSDDPGGAAAGRWSYDVLEDFQAGFLNDLVDFGEEVCDAVADGQRHTLERKQEREWKRRAGYG